MSSRRRNPSAVVVASLALLASLVLPAGSARAGSVHLGVLGGVGYAKLSGPSSPVVDFKPILGGAYGAFVRFEVSPTLAIEPEALAVTDGLSFGESEHTDSGGNSLGTFESLHVLEFLQVPVLVRVTTPGDGIKPFALAGPFAAVRLREYDRSTGDIKSTTTNEVSKSSNFGLTLGGGVQMPAGPGHIELQARYDAGLSSLGDFRSLGTARTGAVRFLAGYCF